MKKIYLSVVFTLTLLFTSAQTETSTKKTYGIDSAEVYTFAEQMPEFPGGDNALMKFLVKNVRYPSVPRSKGIEGKVFLRFVINETGKVSDVQVAKGSGNPALDEEALRVTKLLPKFIPGKNQGKPVKTYFNLPIVFKLQ